MLHGPLESCTARESCHSWVLRLGVADGVGEEWGEGGVPASARGFITPSALLPQIHRPVRIAAADPSPRPNRRQASGSMSFAAENMAL